MSRFFFFLLTTRTHSRMQLQTSKALQFHHNPCFHMSLNHPTIRERHKYPFQLDCLIPTRCIYPLFCLELYGSNQMHSSVLSTWNCLIHLFLESCLALMNVTRPLGVVLLLSIHSSHSRLILTQRDSRSRCFIPNWSCLTPKRRCLTPMQKSLVGSCLSPLHNSLTGCLALVQHSFLGCLTQLFLCNGTIMWAVQAITNCSVKPAANPNWTRKSIPSPEKFGATRSKTQNFCILCTHVTTLVGRPVG